MLQMRNKESSFPICTLMWRPETCVPGGEKYVHARIQEFLSGGVQISVTKKALKFFVVFF